MSPEAQARMEKFLREMRHSVDGVPDPHRSVSGVGGYEASGRRAGSRKRTSYNNRSGN